ncbi:MAG: hypothetical protein KF900_12735 [Bacteroidetes bacterium]|nr:hypothetical protein [Bacteroidota bacterium]
MKKKIIIRLIALLVVVILFNFIYYFTLYKRDVAKNCVQVLEVKNKQAETDIFYFGESSNFTTKENDSIQQSISEITNLFFPQLKFTSINQPASHAGIYKAWLTQINLNERKPKAIIVTLNLRSFNAAWRNSKLEAHLQQSIGFLNPYPPLANRFLMSLNAFGNETEPVLEKKVSKEWRKKQLKFPFPFKYKTTHEWDKEMSRGGYFSTWSKEQSDLACHYIKAYGFNLDEKNPRVNDFDEISDWCREQNIPLYLNLMAENVQYADSLVGKELVFLMRENRDYLVKRYNKNNCKVIDNLESVNGKHFIDQQWTTEHYDYFGRMLVARNLADTLKIQFKNDYKKIY